MIPKKIHYIWLGKNKKDRMSLICLNTWKDVLDEYEIIEWHEDNLPLKEIAENNRFFYYCMKYKLWAFMSDYLRLWILYKEGGIYMDTDVQTLKKFDELLSYNAFLGYEANNYVGTGIIGAEKHSESIKKIMDFYDADIWKVNYYNNPIIFSNVIKKYPDSFTGLHIVPQNVLSPYDLEHDYTNEKVEDEDTITIHWFNSNWGMNRKGYVFLNTKQFSGLRKIIEIIRKNIGYFLRIKGLKNF